MNETRERACETGFIPPPTPGAGESLGGSPRDDCSRGEGRPERLDALELVLSLPVLRAEAVPPPAATRALGIDPCVQEIVRHIAWGGDRRRGAARIELGGGRFAGASVVVQAEGHCVTLEVQAPAGVDGAGLGERLRERLEQRGLVARVLVR